MKNITGIFVIIIVAAMAFVSCEPVENRLEMKGGITADQLEITVTAFEVNGVKSNKLILENRSPILSKWDYGMGTSTKAYDEVLVTAVGDLIVTFTGLNPDGSTVTKDLTVKVDAIIFEVVGMNLLIGEGSKTWVWDAFTNEKSFDDVEAVYPWGIGGIWGGDGDKNPEWWGLTFDDPDFFESDATMTFALDGGAIFIKTLGNGTQKKGSFSFNMAKKMGNDWSQGVLSLKGTTIPHPVSMNNGGPEAYDFYILELEEDNLVLATISGHKELPKEYEGEVNIWMFRPLGWTPVPNDEQMAAITGGSEKTWAWDAEADAVWGNGGYLANKAPGWWTVGINSGDLNQGPAPGEGKGATMSFAMTGAMKKTFQNGDVKSGTYTIDMTKPTMDEEGETWAMGKLKCKDITILNGFNPNGAGKPPVYTYDILKLTDMEMVLAFPEDASGGAWSTAWYFLFRAQ